MKASGIGLATLLAFGVVAPAQAALFDPAYRVIFPAGRAKVLLSPSCAPLPAGLLQTVSNTWTPSAADVDALESKLPAALRTAVGNTHRIGPEVASVLRGEESIANHARQYAGIAIGDRKRILVIAAPIRFVDFDGPHVDFQVQNSSWRSLKPLGTCDGGPNQFSAQYDPTNGQFEDFTFSGTIAGHHAP